MTSKAHQGLASAYSSNLVPCHSFSHERLQPTHSSPKASGNFVPSCLCVYLKCPLPLSQSTLTLLFKILSQWIHIPHPTPTIVNRFFLWAITFLGKYINHHYTTTTCFKHLSYLLDCELLNFRAQVFPYVFRAYKISNMYQELHKCLTNVLMHAYTCEGITSHAEWILRDDILLLFIEANRWRYYFQAHNYVSGASNFNKACGLAAWTISFWFQIQLGSQNNIFSFSLSFLYIFINLNQTCKTNSDTQMEQQAGGGSCPMRHQHNRKSMSSLNSFLWMKMESKFNFFIFF